MKILSIDSPLMQFLTKAADFMLISLMFVLFSLPVFTIGPSATAMYSVFIKRSNHHESSVIPIFWKAFKENFRNSLLTELLLLPMLAVSALLIYLVAQGFADESVFLMLVCFLPCVLTLFAVSYAFPLVAQFENTPGNTVKNAVIMSIGHFPVSIAVTVINLLPLIVLFVRSDIFIKGLPVLSLIGFSIMGWADERLLRKVFRKYFPEEEKKE